MPNKEKKDNKDLKETKEEKKLSLEETIEELKAEVEKYKNNYYLAYADTQNLRKNLEKDHMNAMKYRIEGFIDELLPVLDSFYIALKNEPENPELKNYLIGFQFIYKNLTSVLENEGVKEIEPKLGDEFDSNTMMAVDTVIGEKENKVSQVNLKGYMLHDRLIRPANVVVTVLKKDDEEKKNESKSDA